MALSGFVRICVIRIASLFSIRKRSKVIFYHDIHHKKKYTDMSTCLKIFNRHIQIIYECGYEIVSEITKESGQIEICFDDAFLGLYENIEFFRKHSIPVHLFVISSYLGSKNYMNEKQLLELSKLDGIKISSHTHSHKRLNQMGKNQIERDLKQSKEVLEDLIGVPVNSICYPEGRFNKTIINIAKSVGYKNQYSSLPGFFDNKFADNVIRRSLVQYARESEFKAILKGGDHILAFWYRLKHFSI
jgi:hypothetical protein